MIDMRWPWGAGKAKLEVLRDPPKPKWVNAGLWTAPSNPVYIDPDGWRDE
jgi:hypothetical protein